jgi:hypothetical protein
MSRSRILLALVLASPIALAEPAGDKPLAWNDLVNRPELWPPAVKVTQTIKFTQGPPLAAGTVHPRDRRRGEGGEARDGGRHHDGPRARDVDLVASANTYRSSLSPEQQDARLPDDRRRRDARSRGRDRVRVDEEPALYVRVPGRMQTSSRSTARR